MMEQPLPCKACGGTGREIDHVATGKELRELRKSRGVKMCHIAQQMGITSSQLSMLECGKRNWRPDTIKQYRAAIGPCPETNPTTPAA